MILINCTSCDTPHPQKYLVIDCEHKLCCECFPDYANRAIRAIQTKIDKILYPQPSSSTRSAVKAINAIMKQA